MNQFRPDVVFDCNVFFQAISRAYGPAAQALRLAVAVAADFLVTRDNDLLSIATDHSIDAKQFRQQLPLLRIVTPVEFLSVFTARGEMGR